MLCSRFTCAVVIAVTFRACVRVYIVMSFINSRVEKNNDLKKKFDLFDLNRIFLFI